MTKLSNYLNIETNIKTVPFDDMIENIKYVFENDDYNFFLNSELIDVNNRFRIFNYKKKNYILKKSKLKDGEIEIKYSSKAFKLFNNLEVDNYIIKIVQPNIYYIDNDAYLLTEYMGNSLQELNYAKEDNVFFDINTIFNILKIFLNKGVLYRGFLPRNTIIRENIVYLLDWEDAIFDVKEDVGMNLLWQTNFILNWGYIYDCKSLEQKLKTSDLLASNEPPLLKYEEKFKEITNLDCDDISIRKYIFKTVLDAEREVETGANEFIIPPNDMAHLISDLYNSDLDVIFDISSFVLRKISERKYINYLKLLSISIVDDYINKRNIQKDIIKILLNIFESASDISIKDNNSLLLLFENDLNEFRNKFKLVLNNIMYSFNKTQLKEYIYKRIFDYICTFR